MNKNLSSKPKFTYYVAGTVLIILVAIAIYKLVIPEPEQREYKLALKQNTKYAFNIFLDKYPNSKFKDKVAENLIQLENTTWKNAKIKKTAGALQKYIDSFPEGKYRDSASQLSKNLIETLKKDSLLQIGGIDLVKVHGGTFFMGSAGGDDDETPIHAVTLSTFFIGKYEITQKKWKEIMGTDPSWFKNSDDCPVESVTWNEVQEFLQKLSDSVGYRLRLPTESEWEFAARGGIKSKKFQFSGGDNFLDVAWCFKNSNNRTHPVGKKLPNELGIYDMCGNVWEWCFDNYGIYPVDAVTDPRGTTEVEHRVIRGGCWGNGQKNLRPYDRVRSLPEGKFNNLGFRICF
jgi:formylglycine-generating enzyme required for sulfatase activity